MRKPSAKRKRKNWRMAESLRAREVGAEPFARKPREIGPQQIGVGLSRRWRPLAREKREELADIPRIGLDRVGAAPRSAMSMSRKSARSERP